MNRHVVAGLVGLALAGCAQNRSAMPNRGTGLGPVALPTFPSIHDTINGENPNANAVAVRAAPGLQGVGPGSKIVYSPGQPIVQVPADAPRTAAAVADPGTSAPAPSTIPLEVADPSNAAAAPAIAAVPEPDATQTSAATPVAAAPAAPPAVESAAAAAPPVVEPAAPAEPAAPPAGEAPAAGAAPESLPSAPPSPGAEASPPSEPATGAELNAVPPLALLPDSGGGAGPNAPAPQEPAPGASAPAPPEGTGPPPAAGTPAELPPASESPSGMPPAGEQPATLPPASESPPGAPPGAPPAESSPPALPPADAGAAPAPLPAPAPAAPPVSDPSAGTQPEAVPVPEMPKLPTEPAGAAAPAALPPTPADSPSPDESKTAPGAATQAPAADDKTAALKRDRNVKPTATTDPTVLRSESLPLERKEAGSAAATVGDEVITMSDLRLAVQERLRTLLPPGSPPPPNDQLMLVARDVLRGQIERSVVVQEAKRELKDKTKINMFYDMADRTWREEELEPLLRRYQATNEYELKERLQDQGRSLDQIRDEYRRKFLMHSFLHSKLGSQMGVSLPEMREYYKAHLAEYDRPAQITWREVVIEFDKCPSRADARAKADGILAQLRRGEDFAAVASAMSDGATKPRGGKWETTPGGYTVEAVNTALETLPTGQISQVIEGPTSYHIVRVEDRRAAGPASFPEVQKKVFRAVLDKKTEVVMNTYCEKLMSRTLITTVFDQPPAAPR